MSDTQERKKTSKKTASRRGSAKLQFTLPTKIQELVRNEIGERRLAKLSVEGRQQIIDECNQLGARIVLVVEGKMGSPEVVS